MTTTKQRQRQRQVAAVLTAKGQIANVSSGVTKGWAGWAKFRRPRVQGPPEFNAKKSKIFSFTVKIRTSGYQTLECFIATLPT